MPQPIRVLIVEEQTAEVERMVNDLRQAGFEPDWVRVDTEAAYLAELQAAAANSARPDVILADYVLPQIDALRALELLRAARLDIPLIVVAGPVGEEAAVECIKHGAADYVMDGRTGRLGSAVRLALDRRASKAEAARLESDMRLAEAAIKICSAPDLPTLLQDLVRLTAGLLGAQAGALALVDPGGETLHFAYQHNLAEPLPEHPVPRGPDLAWQIIESAAPLTADYASHPLARPDWKAAGVQQAAGVPLTAGDDVIGALLLFSLSPGPQFAARDLALAEAAGRLGGAALQNVRQAEALRRRVAALTTLHQTGLDLSAQHDLSTLLRTILERAAHMLEASLGGLYLLEADGQTLTLRVYLKAEQDYTGAKLRQGEGLAGRVAQTGAALVVGDYASWPGRAAIFERAPFRASAGVPVRWQGQVLGALVISDTRPDRFGPDDVDIMRLFADQAAVAIVNTRQHASIRRRLQESEAMAAISRALNETLNTERIFLMIVDAARRIIPQVERAVIHLLDEEKQALRPAAVAGLDALGRPDFTMRPGEGVAGQVIAEGVVINVSDTQTDPRYLPLGRATHLRSLLVAPVQSAQRRLGTISVQSAAPKAFSADDEWLLATLGIQAALALENARLFEVERRRAREAEALQQVTQTLISRLHVSEMLQAVVEAISTIANYKCVSIYQLNKNRLALQAQKGHASPPRLLRIDEGVPGRVVRTGRPALVPDVRLDPDHVETGSAVRSLICVPLAHGSEALGVLLVESDADRLLDHNDLNWLTNVGRQLSVALQNTRLVSDLEKALQQEKSARAQLVQSEKLAAMGRLVASVAHELNNPLQAIQNALYLVKQEAALGAQAREDLQVALTEADRMAELISRLRATYRPATSEEFRPESLNHLVEDVRKLITTHLRHNNVTLEFDGDTHLAPVPGLRDQLKQALINLCLNAVEAMPNGGQLMIRTRNVPDLGGVWLVISDTGMGIPPEALPNVFDPFFTTKESGTGLGLAITHDIIRRHGGRIEVESDLGMGTTFRVFLPIQIRPAEA